MNETKRKGLTKVELGAIVAVIVVIAILLALLVPALGNISKMGKQFEDYQKETNQQLADLKDKIENCDCLTAEQLQAKIAEEIKKYHDANPSGLTAEQIDGIVQTVLGKLPAGSVSLTEAQVKKLINDALKKVDTLTEEEVKKLIEDALKKDDEVVDNRVYVNVSTADDLFATLNAGKNAKLTGNITVDGTKYAGRYVITPQGSNVTLNLNGKTLTVTNVIDDLIETNGDFALENGTIKISGPAGEYGAVLCNKGTGTATIKDAVLVSDIDTAVYVVSNMNYGKMIVEDSEIQAKTGCLAAQAGIVSVTDSKFTSQKGHEYFGVTHALFLKANGTLDLNGNITVNIASPVGAEVAAVYNYVRFDQKCGVLTGNYDLTTNCDTEVCMK